MALKLLTDDELRVIEGRMARMEPPTFREMDWRMIVPRLIATVREQRSALAALGYVLDPETELLMRKEGDE